jgi:Protein of Unknown function (DUF2784)
VEVLADAVAVVHGVVVLVMLTGALVALRRPRFVLLHAPVAIAVLAVNVAGADCPLTDLELELRRRAGQPRYTGGFLGHHVFAPLGLDISATGTQIGIYTVAVGLNVVGYTLLVRGMTSRRNAPVRGTLRRGPRWRTPGPRAAALRAGRRTSSRTSAPGRR